VLDGGEALARQVFDLLAKDAPCLSQQDDACVSRALAAFGQVAFRRPLTAEETTRYTGIVTTRRAALAGRSAVELALEVMLASSSFLFRTELGDPPVTG
jgi:hypothetical protein